MTAPRLCVVTAGHLSTCPRMLKAADALHDAGYRVRVVSTRHVEWAWRTDQDVKSRRGWTWQVVDYARSSARFRQLATGARFRVAQATATALGPNRVPLDVGVRGYSRVHDELAAAIASEPCDFVYGGTTGALAAVADGARRLGVPFGLDLEDVHTAEQEGPGSALAHALAGRIETGILPRATLLTASSTMIADAYRTRYGVLPIPIHNTFSLNPATTTSSGLLRMYWFSQTLGPGRGLDDVVSAAGRAGIRAELHLRARRIPAYAEHLMAHQTNVAPLLSLVFHEPSAPDRMVELAQGYDVGLSLEDGDVLNRRLCLGNKIFTYLAAGVPLIMTATPAQDRLAAELGAAATVYPCGDIDRLAEILQRWSTDHAARRAASHAACAAARHRWHWEHADDRGALLSAFRGALS